MWIVKTFLNLNPTARIASAVVGFLLLVLIFFAVRSWFIGGADVKADLGMEQAGAAADTGEAAIETIGGNSEGEAARDGDLAEAQGRVSDTKTATDNNAVGLDALCRNNGICED